MPITVSISLVVIFGSFVSLLVTGAIHAVYLGVVLRLLVGTAALLLAFVTGALAAAVAGRPLSRLFVATHAESRRDFVGRTCVIRTETVTETFGQAEAADPSGATVLIPVRTYRGSDGPALRYGATALIVEYERAAEAFLVSTVDGDLLRTLEGDSPDPA